MVRPSLFETMSPWPKITLVTPAFNSAPYIEQTFRSVVYQDYPNLEYIVVDGGSTDGTVEIIKKYERHFAWWTSEPDQGMYDAINKGFSRSTGEIMGWISGTDMLHLGSLFVLGEVFSTFPEVEWITGIPTGFNEKGMTVGVARKPPRWSRVRFLAGANHWIQQESTFWRRGLWKRTGGYVDATRRNGNDFELWVRFFRQAKLYPVNALIGGYRKHPDSLGEAIDKEECNRVHREVIEAEIKRNGTTQVLKSFYCLGKFMKRIPKVRWLWQRFVVKGLHHIPGPDWPPVIEYREGRWVMRR